MCVWQWQEVQHIFHEHPLVNGEVSEPVMCNGCDEDIQDSCYGCLNSWVMFRTTTRVYTTNIVSFSTKHHRMILGLTYVISVVAIGNGLFTTVLNANLTFILNVLCDHSPLKLKLTTTHWLYSGSWSYSLVIFVVKIAKACPTYVATLILALGSTAIALP